MIASGRHARTRRIWLRVVIVEALVVTILFSAAVIVREHAAPPTDTLIPESVIAATVTAQARTWPAPTTAALHAVQADLPYLSTLLWNSGRDARLSASADPASGQVQITEEITSVYAPYDDVAYRAESDFLALNRAIWTGEDALHPPASLKITISYAPTAKPAVGYLVPQLLAWVIESRYAGENTSWAGESNAVAAWYDYSLKWGTAAVGPWGHGTGCCPR